MTLFELDLPKAYEQTYLKLIKDKLVNRIKTKKKSDGTDYLSLQAKEILIPHVNTPHEDTTIIERLLISEPEDLFNLNTTLDAQLKGLGVQDSDLEEVFGYEDVFDSNSKSKAYKLALNIGASTCCYCNRQYTFTVLKDNRNKNKGDRLARPAFDHWFPKVKYPLLSMSLYNLIPSCTVCNSSAKGPHDMNLNDYIHPYVHKATHPAIKFKAIPSTLPDRKWSIKIERIENTPEDNTIKLFCLDDVYRYHDLLELKDIMDFRDNYPDGYLNDLVTMVNGSQDHSKGGHLSRVDVYRMLFGVEWDDDKHLNRPFGKMKNDILKEIIH